MRQKRREENEAAAAGGEAAAPKGDTKGDKSKTPNSPKSPKPEDAVRPMTPEV